VITAAHRVSTATMIAVLTVIAGVMVAPAASADVTNISPIAIGDINTVIEDDFLNPVSRQVLSNDTDPDGNTLTVVNAGTFALAHGVLQIHADGSYTFTLDNSNPAVQALNLGQQLTDTFT